MTVHPVQQSFSNIPIRDSQQHWKLKHLDHVLIYENHFASLKTRLDFQNIALSVS